MIEKKTLSAVTFERFFPLLSSVASWGLASSLTQNNNAHLKNNLTKYYMYLQEKQCMTAGL